MHTQRVYLYIYITFFIITLTFQLTRFCSQRSCGQDVGEQVGVIPSPPPVGAFIFHRAEASPCLPKINFVGSSLTECMLVGTFPCIKKSNCGKRESER